MVRPRPRGLVAAVLAALVGIAIVDIAGSQARATTVVALSPAELGARSDLVADVVVRSRSTSWVGRRIITFYEVEVLDGWRSDDPRPPATALVALPGGVVDGIGQWVAGTPVFDVGGRYVLCLGDDVGPRGARGVIGLWQGAWLVVPGAPAAPGAHPGADPGGAAGLIGFDHDGPVAARTPLLDVEALRAALVGER